MSLIGWDNFLCNLWMKIMLSDFLFNMYIMVWYSYNACLCLIVRLLTIDIELARVKRDYLTDSMNRYHAAQFCKLGFKCDLIVDSCMIILALVFVGHVHWVVTILNRYFVRFMRWYTCCPGISFVILFLVRLCFIHDNMSLWVVMLIVWLKLTFLVIC